MVKADQLAEYVIRPSLVAVGLHSLAAEQLLVGTACAESKCGTYLHQIRGPALGIFQMEPATHDDLWDSYIRYRSELMFKLRALIPVMSTGGVGRPPKAELLITDLRYAAIMARLLYRRSPRALPKADDWQGHAETWKAVYNTTKGKGTTEHFMDSLKKCGVVQAYDHSQNT